MIKKKIQYLAVLVVILAIVCRVAACGKEPEEVTPTSPHTPTEPVPSISYPKITKIYFLESFGGPFEIEVIATKDEIRYRCFEQDVLGESGPEVMIRTFRCGPGTWEGLLSVLKYGNVTTWKCQGHYLDQYYGKPGAFKEWPNVDFVKEGDFFNITDMNPACQEAIPPYYYGIDQNEKKSRSDYHSVFRLYTDDGSYPSFSRSYESYGIPKGYDRFRKEFWDLVVGCAGVPDWRLELGDWGRENMYKMYPYMLQEGQERQIRYFSLLESYGGKGSAVAVSLVYDGGEQSISYECCSSRKTYSVDRSGQPVLYCEKDPVPAAGGVNKVKDTPGIPGELPGIIEKYGVEDWGTGTDGTGYVRQGTFYNIENAGRVTDENERAIRSGYDALIHILYTDGRHIEIWLENGSLPEGYNDFRDELWDYMIPYINEGRTKEEQAIDWRDMIDQWGEEYLQAIYPYMR